MNILTEFAEFFQYPESLKRLGVCSTCEKFNKQELICNQCGCNMKIKTLIPIFHCPDNKW